jgi:hypothetical protein
MKNEWALDILVCGSGKFYTMIGQINYDFGNGIPMR